MPVKSFIKDKEYDSNVRKSFIYIVFIISFTFLFSIPQISIGKCDTQQKILPKNIADDKKGGNPLVSEQSALSNYSLDLLLNTETNYLHGNLSFDYLNKESIDIDTLFFHLYPNASENEDIPGFTFINDVKTADKQDLAYEFGYQLLNVSLPQPIPPNDSFSLWIDFETAITSNQSYRLNYFDDPEDPEISHVISLCNFYPILAVFDEDGWNLEPLYFVGDPFYSDLANYYVNIAVLNNYKIASSGQLISQTSVSKSHVSYQYQLFSARDFAFALSPDYIVETGLFDNTAINIYFLPDNVGNWSNSALFYAKYALSLFSDLYGPYPYPTYAVASTYGFYGGMEWPGLVYIQSGYQYTEMSIAHETAHQWFYGVVGNDQIDEGFLDEGLVCYNHWYYFEHRYGYQGFFTDNVMRTAENNNPAMFPEGLIINRSINDIVKEDLDPAYYWEAAYHKAPAVFHLLRTYIGDEAFFNALQLYYTTSKFQMATFTDLTDCFNYYIDINWFLPWFNEGFLPEIQLLSAEVIQNNDTELGYKLILKLKQNSPSSYPAKIPLRINFKDSSSVIIWTWCNNSNIVTFQQNFDALPRTIEADPNSGYLYTLDLLTMKPLEIETKFDETTGLKADFFYPIVVLIVSTAVFKRKSR
ncbi:MAG: M1 family metallopeptidase [Candidatus Hodarchaeales archaeon]|jgi:hypothetical protein